MKRILFLVLISVFACHAAWGGVREGFSLGIQGNLMAMNDVFPRTAELSFKLPKLPAIFGLCFPFQKKYWIYWQKKVPTTIALRFDWWLCQTTIVRRLGFYFGVGIGSSINFKTFSRSKLGLRVPIGFQLFVFKPVEVFLEVSPMVIFILEPDLDFLGAIGVRFWL
ncbi:MAG: hypothetical protein ACE5LC_05345 [Candidatus Aminicenantales bacterium]